MKEGLARFMEWCGPDAALGEWGLDDCRFKAEPGAGRAGRGLAGKGVICSGCSRGSGPGPRARA